MTPRFRNGILILVGLAVCIAAWVIAEKNPSSSAPVAVPAGGHSSSKSQIRKASSPRNRNSPTDADNPGNPLSDEALQEWLKKAEADHSGTLAKVIQLPETTERRELLEWILSAWTTEDREPALDWLKQSLKTMPDDPAEESIDLLIGPWAQEDPSAAISWVEDNISGPWKNTGFQSVAETWAEYDPEAMATWIEGQSSPPDIWKMALLQSFIPTDPAKAMEWCDRLADPAQAKKSREEVIQAWITSDPGEAGEYLRGHPEMMPKNLPPPVPAVE